MDRLIEDLVVAVRNGDDESIRTLIAALAAVADHHTLIRLRRRLDGGLRAQ